uniref:protein ROH1 n=1 Tax=Erigeron canadensis TaxID=72917 RepID=UPI001CB9BE06|nr:protein ROH1 [Erigeron canadensis]
MPIDYHGSSSPSFTRSRHSILSMKRDQVVYSLDNQTQDHELEAFQKNVTQMFHNLSLVESTELLSISWVSKLLDVFIFCQEQFRFIQSNNKTCLSKQPMEKAISDYFERSVKGLDVCNAIRDGIEQMRQWQKQLEIGLSVLKNKKDIGEAQLRRVKRALTDLTIEIVDIEKDSNMNVAQRHRSFNQKDLQHQQSKFTKQSRSLSCSVLRYWSASKQLQAIGNNIVLPKNSEIVATNGLILAVYTMSHVLSFVMWALVAAIPCQGRGLQAHFNTFKNFTWGVPITSLYERILEEYKKRDRRNSCGLLKEIHSIEMYVSYMNGFIIDSMRFPLRVEQEKEVKKRIEHLEIVYESVENGLGPLERQVREVFHRIIRCRIEGIGSVSRKHSSNR